MGSSDLDSDDICLVIIVVWILFSSLIFAISGWFSENMEQPTHASTDASIYFAVAVIMAFIGMILSIIFLDTYVYQDS